MSTAATRDTNAKQVVPFSGFPTCALHPFLHARPRLHHEAQVACGRKVALVLVGTGWRGFNAADVKDSRNATVGKFGQGVALSFQCEDAVKTVW